MSETIEPTPTGPLQPAAAPARRRGGFLGRFVAALLVVIITTFLALVGVAVALLALGFTPETPRQFAEIQARLETAEALNDALRLQNSAMQTQVIDLTRRSQGASETLGDLRQQLGDLDRLREEFAAGARQNATLVADARASRDSVTLFATAEASRAALLEDLKRRSDRLERFLQRLSDISGDAALDLGGVTPTTVSGAAGSPSPAPDTTATSAPATPVPTDAPTAAPTTTPRPTGTPRLSPTASP